MPTNTRRLRRLVLTLLIASPACPVFADTYRNPFVTRNVPERTTEPARPTATPTTTRAQAYHRAAAPQRLPSAPAPQQNQGWVEQRGGALPAQGFHGVVNPGTPLIAGPGYQSFVDGYSSPQPQFVFQAPPVSDVRSQTRKRPLRLPPIPKPTPKSTESVVRLSVPSTARPNADSSTAGERVGEANGSISIAKDSQQPGEVSQQAVLATPADPLIEDTQVGLPTSNPVSPNTQLASDRSDRHGAVAGREEAVAVKKTSWLQSITPTTCQRNSLRLLDDANREYSVRAWVSAEASAWESLAYAAQAIDVTNQQTDDSEAGNRWSAARSLVKAKTAIREARDFSLLSDPLDADAIRRVVLSHQTNVLKDELLGRADDDATQMGPAETVSGTTISASVAADRYLDHARELLSRLAKCQVSVAATLDLLAAIQLGRDESHRLPAATALCLRRAAFQGQPGNASLANRLGMQLADMGLDDEAKYALELAMSIQPTDESARTLASVMRRSGDRQAALELTAQLKQDLPSASSQPRVPEIIQLSPEQFASISPSVNTAENVSPTDSSQPFRHAAHRNKIQASAAGFRQSTQLANPGAYAQETGSPFSPSPDRHSVPPVSPIAFGGSDAGSPPGAPTSPSATYNANNGNSYMQPQQPRISKVQQLLGRVSEFW